MKKGEILSNVGYKSTAYLKRCSPTILTYMGAMGVIATSVMAVKATPKAMRLIELADDEKEDELTKLDMVLIAGRVYIPTAIMGMSTIATIFAANMLNKRYQASLISAYAMLNQSYDSYKRAANSVYGEDADSKIKAEVAKDVYVSSDGMSIYSPDSDKDSEKILFYDDYSRRYFISTMASVINAQYHLNRNLIKRGEAGVNEFYEFLGIDKIDCGDAIGWSMDELMIDDFTWLDFENSLVKMDDGLECYIISAIFSPTVLNHDED